MPVSRRGRQRVSVYYVGIAAVYGFALWYNVMFISVNDSTVWTYEGYGGKFKYLTFLNMILQTLYFGLCLVNAFSGSNVGALSSPRKCSGLQRLRDNFHSTLAFPVGMFVVATFWILFFIDRDLIFPESRAKVIPAWITHNTHTTVLPILLVEKMLVYHHHPRRHNGIFILTAFALTYLLWILWIAYAADLWVYPILRVMSTQERSIFIAFLLMFFISIYLLGESLTTFIWRKERAVGVAAMKQK